MAILNKQLVVRMTAQDLALYEHRAKERGLSVSDLVRFSVEAFCAGEVGVAFVPSCGWSRNHRPGHICPGCGGSRRQAA